MFLIQQFLHGSTVLLAAAILGNAQSKSAELQKSVSFNRDIRPILSNNCYSCHGPDKSTRKAKLRIDNQKDAHEETIVPGKPEESEFYYRISTDDEDDMMPHPDSTKSLTQGEKDLLKRWIEEGAEYEKHWAYVAPKPTEPPVIENRSWTKNPIDQFVLARLAVEGLSPVQEAERRTLIRRVSLDLIGLPPTPQEVEDFVSDAASDAYEKLVDRVLNSPAYGEHMARFWLDAARYGDTHGLHLDNYREIWPYRDWVISAFNDNKSFDDFLLEQMAGDLLPNPNLNQLIATGFNRAHVTTNEGGSIDEEVYVRNVLDRVTTFGTVFMGLTSGCAVCHDHKFDPLKQKEFYQFFAFFNSLDGKAMDGNRKDHAPIVKLPNDEQKDELAGQKKQLSIVQETLIEQVSSYKYVEPDNPKPPPPLEPKEIVWIEDSLPQGAKTEGEWKLVEKENFPVYSGKKALTQTAIGLGQHLFSEATKPLTVKAGDKLFTYVYLDPYHPPKQLMLEWNDGNWEHRAYWGENLIERGLEGTVNLFRAGDLPSLGEWARLEVDADSVGLNPGAKINGWAFVQFDGTTFWDKAGIVTLTQGKPDYDSFAVWFQDQHGAEEPMAPDELIPLLKKDATNLTEEENKQLLDYFVEHVCVNTRYLFDPPHQWIKSLKKQISNTEKGFPTTLVWKELEKPRDAFILDRGLYNMKKEKVTRRTPEFLPPFPENAPENRLGLAKWLLMEDHPLTARVTVNRFWQHVFGVGIVKTTEDFGAQGEWPSHPELLDWLAIRFVRSGWDVKKLMRLMVTSAAYRQSSSAPRELYERDPENRLLARGPRFRLDAETLRDQALAISGLLLEKLGGPGVKPPQPDGLWFAVGYTGSNTVRFKEDRGPEKVHRRSIYTFWKRTSPPPQMNTFDAPSREACSVRRERTNTPLQALLLMNDPQYFEAARALAERMIRDGGNSIEERLSYGFKLATTRAPGTEESRELVSVYQDYLAEYRQDSDAVKKLNSIGEFPSASDLDEIVLAVCTMVANIILNLDEVLNKG